MYEFSLYKGGSINQRNHYTIGYKDYIITPKINGHKKIRAVKARITDPSKPDYYLDTVLNIIPVYVSGSFRNSMLFIHEVYLS